MPNVRLSPGSPGRKRNPTLTVVGHVESPLVDPKLRVRDLEAVDGTPIVDVKPVIAGARDS